jgi:DHA1 family tetracycline resistance protein-like MFS transporter
MGHGFRMQSSPIEKTGTWKIRFGGYRRLSSPRFILAMTIFIDATGFGMIIPLLPFITESLQAGSTALGILIASFSVMQFVFSPILGRISDKIGRKPILLLSILTSMASFGLFVLANSFLLLLISRLVAGLATETGVAQAYIADVTSKKDRAEGIGKIGAAHGAGFIVGPAMGGFLSVYGFSAAGIAAIILTSINFLFVLFLLPESLTKERLENSSLTKSNESVLRQLRNVFSKGLIGLVLAIFFIVFLSFSAIPVIVPLLGVAFFGLGSVEMSYLFVYIGLVQIALQGFLIGRLVARIGDLNLVVFSPFFMMMGTFFMPLFSNLGIFIVSLTMIASGSGIMRTVVPSYISKATAESEQGGILGVTNSVASIATVPGPLIGGFLFEFVGLISPFFISALLLLFSFILGLGARRKA